MQAIVLAGGKGTRLGPFTTVLPKPLMPVGEYPILEILVRQLKSQGVSEIILAVGHLRHLIESYFQNGERFGVSIKYSIEEVPLGTAGPLSKLMPDLDENFLVLNGDLLTTFNFNKAFEEHVKSQAAATIGVFNRTHKVDFGVLNVSPEGAVVGYKEKPAYEYKVSMGINIFNKRKVLPFLSDERYLDIPDLMTQLMKSGEQVKAYEDPCIWLDIGRMDDYSLATDLFEKNRGDFF